MDLQKIILELQAERQRLDEAIEALERLSTGDQRRRGRPPRCLKDLATPLDGLESVSQDGAGRDGTSK